MNLRIIALTGLCILTVACGVKPGQISSPEGSDEDAFPRTYPDLNTDPKP